jgi:uncharacterized protein YndB with AHSA1/START domain
MRVEREVVVAATPAAVWEAVFDGDQLAGWLVEPGEPVRQVRIEAVEAERYVRFQWWPDDGSGPRTEVDLDLAPVDGGTRVRVVETFVGAPPRRPLGFQLRARALVSA